MIVATGPLTSPDLAATIRALTGEDALAFFDAIAPIVHRESIDLEQAWFQSRYDKTGPGGSGADYINCPLSREQYDAFVDALLAGDKTEFHDWETSTPYFDGCLPIEVMAERGRETLRHGPMKPFGLTNPRAPDVKPYAVVQLRQDNKLGTLFNMVGFQTKLKHGEQVRIFRTIPGLQNAEFARLGGLHRNTFLNSPKLLDETLRLKANPRLALCRPDHRLRGLCRIRRHRPDRRALCRRRAARRNARAPRRRPRRMARCSPTSPAAISRPSTPGPSSFQPMNVNFGLFPPIAAPPRRKAANSAAARPRTSRARARSANARWPISIAGSPANCRPPAE